MKPESSTTADHDGYYFSPSRAEIDRAGEGDFLPAADDWEYLGSVDEMTPADAVAEVEDRYPDISVELTVKDK